jgi:osmotically inducible protein OsmC
MAVRSSHARWEGNLKDGSGSMKLGSGFFEGPFTFASRFENGKGTNPEELIGAAHAGCYSMFLSAILSADGHAPNSVETTAAVHLGDGPTINKIELTCRADVPGIDAATFADYAQRAKEGCPVSKALAAVDEITLDASLI